MNKAEFTEALAKGRADWDSMIALIPQDRMAEPGVGGGDWSVKDVISHNNWNEIEMVTMLRQRDLDTKSDARWDLSNDDRNHIMFERDRDQSLDGVLTQNTDVHKALLEEVAKLEDADLNDSSRFANMPDGWLPWQIIAGCTFNHYPEHIRELEKWWDDNKDKGNE